MANKSQLFYSPALRKTCKTPRYSTAQLIREGTDHAADAVLFWGHHPNANGTVGASCLSQWFIMNFVVDDQHYSCMEQYMMAGKARLFGDGETLEMILSASDPAVIKKLGRQVKNFDDAVWNMAKYSIILNGNCHKFSQNLPLRDYLLSTGDRLLVEASPYDRIWGIGLAAEDPRARDPRMWQGENLLGFALMEVRDMLRSE